MAAECSRPAVSSGTNGGGKKDAMQRQAATINAT